MRGLLDTQAFPWFVQGDTRLPLRVRLFVADPANETFGSIVSCWEIAIKYSIGKLTLTISLDELIQDGIERNAISLLGIDRLHVLQIASMPRHHGDPFDRLLVAQAEVEGFVLLSADQALDAYGVHRNW